MPMLTPWGLKLEKKATLLRFESDLELALSLQLLFKYNIFWIQDTKLSDPGLVNKSLLH